MVNHMIHIHRSYMLLGRYLYVTREREREREGKGREGKGKGEGEVSVCNLSWSLTQYNARSHNLRYVQTLFHWLKDVLG